MVDDAVKLWKVRDLDISIPVDKEGLIFTFLRYYDVEHMRNHN